MHSLARHRGFTLIELLVVISVIAILAAILLPAINLVRASANTAKCGSNLRQIALSVMGYAADNDGMVPPWCVKEPERTVLFTNGSIDFYGNWWWFISTYVPDFAQSPVFLCPSGNWKAGELRALYASETNRFKQGNWWYNSSYGYNRNLDATDSFGIGPFKNWYSGSISLVARPSSTVLMGERWAVNTDAGRVVPGEQPVITAEFGEVTGEGHDGVATSESLVRLSHRGKANFVFFDGHVDLSEAKGLRPTDLARFFFDAPNQFLGRY